MSVAVEVFRVIRAAMDFGEFCARRTGVIIMLGVVDEVLPVNRTSRLEIAFLYGRTRTVNRCFQNIHFLLIRSLEDPCGPPRPALLQG